MLAPRRRAARRDAPASPARIPPLDVESLAAPRRRRAQQAAHDGRVRVLPAVPPPVRARVLRRRGLGVARPARAARATTARRSRTAGTTGLSDAEQQAAIRGLLLLVGALNGRFGRKRIAALAIGTDDDPRFDGAARARLPARLVASKQVHGSAARARRRRPDRGVARRVPDDRDHARGDQVAVGKLDPGELGIQMPTPASAKPSAAASADRAPADRARRGPSAPRTEHAADRARPRTEHARGPCRRGSRRSRTEHAADRARSAIGLHAPRANQENARPARLCDFELRRRGRDASRQPRAARAAATVRRPRVVATTDRLHLKIFVGGWECAPPFAVFNPNCPSTKES